jgi:hypothetical protein
MYTAAAGTSTISMVMVEVVIDWEVPPRCTGGGYK